MSDKQTEPIVRVSRHHAFADQVGEGLEGGFPFDSVLSFEPVVEKWRQLTEKDPDAYSSAWAEIERDIQKYPQLFEGPIEDLSLLAGLDDVIERLTHPFFPSSDWSSEARAISQPFGGAAFYQTNQYRKKFGTHAASVIESLNVHYVYVRTLYAYKAILKLCYDFDLRLDQPLIFALPEEGGSRNSYLKLTGGMFVTVEPVGEKPALSEKDMDSLLQNIFDLRIWQRLLPPERFKFVGLSTISLADVTHETAVAAVTQLILNSSADMTDSTILAMEDEFRSLFAAGSLRLGLASLQADKELNFTSDRRIWNSLVIRDDILSGTFEWRQSLYGRVLRDGTPFVFPDIERNEVDETLRESLLRLGVRSLALQPLRYEDTMVGLIELTSPEPRTFDASTLLKMRRIEPVLALAVYQNVERFETRVQSAIQRTYTAIHPSVRWRFREAAIEMIEAGDSGVEASPIDFEEVYPLYGASDIRSSTQHRNNAVRHDVIAKLTNAREVISSIQETFPLAILDELESRIANRIEQYNNTWNSGDETAALQFINREVDPSLKALCNDRHDLKDIFQDYENRQRKGAALRSEAYEESRRSINRCIADLLMSEQAVAQQVYPHYFEHKITDGVEHTMYIGQSVTPDRAFDMTFVRNLRLRQLISACNIGRSVRDLAKTLAMPLDIAQLIVVQHKPIVLRFRTDEKRFDVDGASGVRFELLKSRLDKAHVKGTDERITQPERISIVYSMKEEETEYLRYADYLAGNGYIERDQEHLLVEDLPGISGLKLIRLKVSDG